MLKSKKSQLTCSFCSRIFKDPIDLPCGDTICHEHVKERVVVKQNKIKCKQCNGEFQVKDNGFKSSKAYQKLVESQSHLSDEEISLKQDLEASIRKFVVLLDEFAQNKNKIESDIF
jgi:hypothetical protein